MGNSSELSDWVKQTLLTWLRIAENRACLISPLGRAAIRIRGLLDRKKEAHFHTTVFGIRQLCAENTQQDIRGGLSTPCSVRTAAKALITQLEPLARYTIPTAQWEVQETLERLRTIIQHAR